MTDFFQNLLSLLLLGCGITLVKYICALINKKIDALQETTELNKYLKLNQYIDTAQLAVTTSVTSVMQTFTETLKANGSFDAAAQKEAKEKAALIAKNLITEDVKNAVETVYGDYLLWLDHAIEENVRDTKF